MGDEIVKAITGCGSFRAVAAVTTSVIEEIRKRQSTYPVATAALGRTLTAAFLLATDLKGNERVMIQVLGDGPLGEIYAEADSRGRGRGFVRNPHVNIPCDDDKLGVGKGVGNNGTFTVIRDLELKEPYRGVVPLVSGEIGKDLAYYLTLSEQIPSAVGLGVFLGRNGNVKAAGGYLIQTMPQATDDDITQVERNLEGLPLPSTMVMDGRSPEEILFMALEGFQLAFLEKRSLSFFCNCSRERFSEALVAMGKEELKGLLEKRETVELTCEFCMATYNFTVEDLNGLLREL